MQLVQSILVYIILTLAVAYLLKKFVLPKTLFTSKKGNTEGCGEGDCGCH